MGLVVNNPLRLATGEAFLGSTFNFAGTGSYEAIGLSISLPSAGTYRITARVKARVGIILGGPAVLTFKLRNTTDSTDLTSSESLAFYTTTLQQNSQSAFLEADVTVTAAKTIAVFGQRNTGPTYSVTEVTSDTDGRSRIAYLRIA